MEKSGAGVWPADRVERWQTDALIPSARNSRKHSAEQVAQIAASITEFGFTIPVLVDEGGEIIAGHGRVMAAKKLGLAEVPVMVAHGWSEAQKRAYRIADNKLTENSEWDEEMLRIEMRDLFKDEFDLGLTGFDADAIADFTGVVDQLAEMPALPDGDKQPFQQFTFTLHSSQAETLRAAMEAARAMGPFDESVNENKNGNALARICERFLEAQE